MTTTQNVSEATARGIPCAPLELAKRLFAVGFCRLRYGRSCPHIPGIGDRPWDRW